jgi:GH24 family phage-related lysozyme (muramidase)
VRRLIKHWGKQNQFDALTSLATDIGIDTFRKSTLLKKHNLRCFSCAVAHFIVWSEKTDNKAKRKAEKEVYWYGY